MDTRNTSYYVTVTAYNAGGSASSSLYITEIIQVCANIAGSYTAYSDSSRTTVIGSASVTMNVSTGTGTVNNGSGDLTITYTSYNGFYVSTWGLSCTYNTVNQLSWTNGTVWRRVGT